MPLEWVIQANSLSAGLLRPDINIFIDVSPEVSMNRLNNGRASLEIYETIDNLKNVRAKYFEAMEVLKNEENIFNISGNRPTEQIATDIWSKISGLMA
jgi:dTMP kinase